MIIWDVGASSVGRFAGTASVHLNATGRASIRCKHPKILSPFLSLSLPVSLSLPLLLFLKPLLELVQTQRSIAWIQSWSLSLISLEYSTVSNFYRQYRKSSVSSKPHFQTTSANQIRMPKKFRTGMDGEDIGEQIKRTEMRPIQLNAAHRSNWSSCKTKLKETSNRLTYNTKGKQEKRDFFNVLLILLLLFLFLLVLCFSPNSMKFKCEDHLNIRNEGEGLMGRGWWDLRKECKSEPSTVETGLQTATQPPTTSTVTNVD